MANTDFTVRNIINPYKELGNVVGSMTDKLIVMRDAEDKQRKEQAKADQEFAEKQAKINKEQLARSAIVNYQSPIGKFGGIGIPTNVLGNVSDDIGSRIEGINTKYSVDPTSPVTSLPVGQQEAYRKDIRNVSDNTRNVMSRLADPSSGVVTEGAAEGVMLRDLLRKGANPKEAAAVARTLSDPFSTRKELKAEEATATSALNKVIDSNRRSAEAKRKIYLDDYDRLYKEASKKSIKIDKSLTPKDMYETIDSLGVGFKDNADVIAAVDKVLKNPIDGNPVKPYEVIRALESSYTQDSYLGGLFQDNDVRFKDGTELANIIKNNRASGNGRYSKSLTSLLESKKARFNDPKLIDTITNTQPLVPSSINEVQAGTANNIVKDIFGGRAQQPTSRVPITPVKPASTTVTRKKVRPDVTTGADFLRGKVQNSVPRTLGTTSTADGKGVDPVLTNLDQTGGPAIGNTTEATAVELTTTEPTYVDTTGEVPVIREGTPQDRLDELTFNADAFYDSTKDTRVMPDKALENLTPYFLGGVGAIRALLTNAVRRATSKGIANKAAKAEAKRLSNTPEALFRKKVEQEATVANKANRKLFKEWNKSSPKVIEGKDRRKELLDILNTTKPK